MLAQSQFENTTLGRLLRRTGSLFILIVAAVAQLLSLPAAVIGSASLQLNGDFTSDQLRASVFFTSFAIFAGNAVLLIWVYSQTRDASRRLDQWAKGQVLIANEAAELPAWQQITSLAWRYGVAAIIVAAFINVFPLLAYQSNLLHFTLTQLVYSLFSNTISALGRILLSVLIIERALMPAREILLPKSFESQLAGAVGVRLFGKYQGIILAIILYSVLLLAPAGYHQTYRALFLDVGNPAILTDLQSESFALSVMILVLGIGLSFLLSRSVSEPIHEIISVFSRVERGDLTARARVTATDEIGELAVYFNRMIARLERLQQNLEYQVAERTAQLTATNEVGRIANSILEPDTLLSQVVNLITDRFGYYYAAIFLVDSAGVWAELREATGTAGQILKAQRHRLQLGGKNMVSIAIANRQARIALDVGLEAFRFNNPLLPETRSEIALPLIVGERVLGALDVQSREEGAFSGQDVETLQNMANQVAIALENAHLFQETRENLDEIRSIHAQYMSGAWSDKIRTTDLQFTVEQAGGAPSSGDLESLSVPLTLREQALGEIELLGDRAWLPEDRNWVEAIATQVSISLENARLIEESQQTALRERLAAAITERIWSSPSIDVIMQTAVRELGRALDASEAAIELKVEE